MLEHLQAETGWNDDHVMHDDEEGLGTGAAAMRPR